MTEVKYSLRSWIQGYEVPFLDIMDPAGQGELSKSIKEKYLDWFECVKVDLEIFQLLNGNQLVLFTIIVRVDHDLTSDETLVSDWNFMKSDLKKSVEEFLTSRNLIFKPIDCNNE